MPKHNKFNDATRVAYGDSDTEAIDVTVDKPLPVTIDDAESLEVTNTELLATLQYIADLGEKILKQLEHITNLEIET